MEQFEQFIQAGDNLIDVDLLDYIRQEEFISDLSKQATAGALVWWASVSDEILKRPHKSEQIVASDGNI